MGKVEVGDLVEHFDEGQQKIAAVLRAILSTELDRWEIERRKTLQHPKAQQYTIRDEKLEIPLECDWFYIYGADPVLDHFTYYVWENGAGTQTIIPRNVKRYGPVRKGIVILPVGFTCTFWIVWGIGTKDSNLSFEYRLADETFQPQTHLETLVLPGPPGTPILTETDNGRIQTAVYNFSGGSDVELTDAAGIVAGIVLPAGSLTWIDHKSASDVLYLKTVGGGPAALVRTTAYNVARIYPSV